MANDGLKIGLALGGGAARGLAHLGVIEVLEQAGVPVHLIAGSSMGSLVGVMYATQPRVDKLIRKATEFFASEAFLNSRIHNLNRGEEEEPRGVWASFGKRLRQGLVLGSQVTRLSYLEEEDLFGLLRPFVDDRDLRSLQIPMTVVVCDLVEGRELLLRKGPAIDAIAASSAVPGAFPPIRINGVECVDGGTVHMVPARIVREMGADVVIAVNVSHDYLEPPELKRALELFFRTHEITKRTLIDMQLREADVVVTPNVGPYHWADFGSTDKIIDAGREAAAAALPDIQRILADASRGFWRSLFHRRSRSERD
jgi:NTE family protein